MNYNFLKQDAGSAIKSNNYSFLGSGGGVNEKPRIGRLVNIPEHLGGGEYISMDDGGLYTLPRTQDPIGKSIKGFERDHVIPVSLGGLSTVGNLQYLESKPSFLQKVKSFLTGKESKVQQSPKRQEGKLKKEQEIINAFNKGDITLGQARTQIGMKQMEIKGLAPSEKEMKASHHFLPELGKQAGKAFGGLGLQMGKTVGHAILGSLDLMWRTGLQGASGLGLLATSAVTLGAKFLGDKSLEYIDYDELWAQNTEAAFKRMTDIGLPHEYFRSLATGTEYREMKLFNDEALKIAEDFHSESRTDIQRTGDVLKIAGLGFMREFANPLWAFSFRGVKVGSFKKIPRNKIVYYSKEFNPFKEDWLGKKLPPTKASIKLETQPLYEMRGAKVKKVKQPEIWINLEINKKGVGKIEVSNKGGKIFNKELLKDISETPPIDVTPSSPGAPTSKSVLIKPINARPIINPLNKAKNPIVFSEGDKVLKLFDFADGNKYLYYSLKPSNLDKLKADGITPLEGDAKAIDLTPNELLRDSNDLITRINLDNLNRNNIISTNVDKLNPKSLTYNGILPPEVIEVKTPDGWQSITKIDAKPIIGYHITRDGGEVGIRAEGFSLKNFGLGSESTGDPKGIYFFPEDSKIPGDWMHEATFENTFKRELDIKKPYIPTTEKAYIRDIVEPAIGYKVADLDELRFKATIEDSEKITKQLQSKGYDGIIDKKGVLSFKEPQVVVFDPKQITKELPSDLRQWTEAEKEVWMYQDKAPKGPQKIKIEEKLDPISKMKADSEKLTKQLKDDALAGRSEDKRLDAKKKMTNLSKELEGKSPNDKITIYRAAKKNIALGDQVTVSKGNAERCKKLRPGSSVYKKETKVRDLIRSGGLKSEFIYAPKELLKIKPKEGVGGALSLKETSKKQDLQSLSRHYERIKDQYGFVDGIEFTKQQELAQKKKAFDLIQRNPERALRLGYGMEEMPKEINEQIFRASLIASLMKDGKVAVAQDIAKIQSLKLTESAQNLAFAKTDLGKEASIIKNITEARLKKIGAKLGENKPAKQVEAAKDRIKKRAKERANEVGEEVLKSEKQILRDVDKLIDDLIC